MDQLMICHHWSMYWFGTKKSDKLLREQMVTQLPDIIYVSLSLNVLQEGHWFTVNQRCKMAYLKTAVTPLLTHWSYCSLALSHQYYDCLMFATGFHVLIKQLLVLTLGLEQPTVTKYVSRHFNTMTSYKRHDLSKLNHLYRPTTKKPSTFPDHNIIFYHKLDKNWSSPPPSVFLSFSAANIFCNTLCFPPFFFCFHTLLPLETSVSSRLRLLPTPSSERLMVLRVAQPGEVEVVVLRLLTLSMWGVGGGYMQVRGPDGGLVLVEVMLVNEVSAEDAERRLLDDEEGVLE